jgi:hypothetical protein
MKIIYNFGIHHIHRKHHLQHENITTLLTALAATTAAIQLYAFIIYVANN